MNVRYTNGMVGIAWCLLWLLFWCTGAGAVLIDGVAAVVNDDIILQSELREILESYRQEYAAKYSGAELQERMRATVRSVLDAAIERQLLIQEARRLESAGRGIEIDEKQIDEAVRRVRDRFDSEEEFRKALAEYGETIATFRKKREEDFLARRVAALKGREIEKEVTILEQDIQDYYEKGRDGFAIEPTRELFKIFVPADPYLPEAERALRRGMIEEVLEEINAGTDPEQIAERLATGDASVPLEIDRGELPSELEREVSSMREGEVSGVLESERGFYIVKVVHRDARLGLDDPELRARIESALRAERVQGKYDQWLRRLRENARISIYFRQD